MNTETKQPVFRSPVVMLIDDQAIVEYRVKELLKNEVDISFHYCPDPATAVAQAIQIKPSVVLMDLVMPNIDGLTLCRVFRETSETADIPIIMLSANDDGITKAHSFSSGANDYLVKLPEQIEFIARIRYHSKSYTIKLERDEAYEALCQSQMELEALNDRLQKMAHYDELTKLPNRPLFLDRLAMMIAQAKRNERMAAVLFLDLDDFKPINDLYGHQAGDEALKIVAQRLTSILRETDTVARFGGDEFAVVIGNMETAEYASRVAEKIIKSISTPLALSNEQQAKMGISIGISLFPDDSRELNGLIAYADHAMYESKRGSKNCFFFYSDIKQNDFADDLWLAFKDEYMSGVKSIDQQHIELLQLVNQLKSLVTEQADSTHIESVFDQLLNKTIQHFSSEEELLTQYAYPEIKEHRDDHQHLLAELELLKVHFQEQGRELEALQLLKSWLLKHMIYGDKKSNAYLVTQGAS